MALIFFFKSENYNLLQTVNLIQQTGIVVDQLLRNHDKVNFVLVLHRYRVFELRASVLTSSGSGALSQELHQGFISQTTCLYNYCVFRPICIFFFYNELQPIPPRLHMLQENFTVTNSPVLTAWEGEVSK